jgi:hypothetical protein
MENYRKEGEFLLNKANQYATRLAASNLNEMDTFIFHRSMYVPSMTYSLPVTMLDTEVLNKIQCQAVQAILTSLESTSPFLAESHLDQRISVAWLYWT